MVSSCNFIWHSLFTLEPVFQQKLEVPYILENAKDLISCICTRFQNAIGQILKSGVRLYTIGGMMRFIRLPWISASVSTSHNSQKCEWWKLQSNSIWKSTCFPPLTMFQLKFPSLDYIYHENLWNLIEQRKMRILLTKAKNILLCSCVYITKRKKWHQFNNCLYFFTSNYSLPFETCAMSLSILWSWIVFNQLLRMSVR